MAIDSAAKRKAISGIPLLIPGVTPNATPDAAWRQQSGWSYSGITPDSPSVQTQFTGLIANAGRLLTRTA